MDRIRTIGVAMDGRKKLIGAALAMVVLLGGVLLGPSLAGASDGAVSIQNFAFGPTPVTVNAGDTVTWTQHDTYAVHTVTADATSVEKFDSGNLSTDTGVSFSHTFNTPGTFTYHCAIHPSMTGTVVVLGSSSTTTTPGSTTTTTPAPPTTTTTTTTTTPAPPTTPRLGSASLTDSSFSVGHNATAFRFTLTAPANVKVVITHVGHGHRTVRDGSFTVKHVAKGKARVRFSGRVGHHALKPGTYRATITATNGAGSAKPVRVKFRIVR
jgi:plastocyanin